MFKDNQVRRKKCHKMSQLQPVCTEQRKEKIVYRNYTKKSYVNQVYIFLSIYVEINNLPSPSEHIENPESGCLSRVLMDYKKVKEIIA